MGENGGGHGRGAQKNDEAALGLRLRFHEQYNAFERESPDRALVGGGKRGRGRGGGVYISYANYQKNGSFLDR